MLLEKLLEGVGKLGWGLGMDNTFFGSLYVTLKYLGMNVSYPYLMGVSGMAFRIHFHREWCPSSNDATVGFNCGERGLRVLGLRYRVLVGDEPAMVEEERKAIVESINKGVPVLGIELSKAPDWGVITGYREWGRVLLCRTYWDEGEEYSIAEKWPWAIVVFKEPFTMERRDGELLVRTFKLASTLWRTRMYDEYYSGRAAYMKWIAELELDSRFRGRRGEELMFINAWIYKSGLLDSRIAATSYLRHMNDRLDVDLSELVEGYEKLVEVLTEGVGYAPYPWEEQLSNWMGEGRHKLAQILRRAMMMEGGLIKTMEELLPVLRTFSRT